MRTRGYLVILSILLAVFAAGCLRYGASLQMTLGLVLLNMCFGIPIMLGLAKSQREAKVRRWPRQNDETKPTPQEALSNFALQKEEAEGGLPTQPAVMNENNTYAAQGMALPAKRDPSDAKERVPRRRRRKPQAWMWMMPRKVLKILCLVLTGTTIAASVLLHFAWNEIQLQRDAMEESRRLRNELHVVNTQLQEARDYAHLLRRERAQLHTAATVLQKQVQQLRKALEKKTGHDA